MTVVNNPQYLNYPITNRFEYRRNFNIGDFESCSIVTVVDAFCADKNAFLQGQIALIEQALELFKYRKTAAKQAFNNKLADFCERQETQLMKERDGFKDELSKCPPTQTPPTPPLNPAIMPFSTEPYYDNSNPYGLQFTATGTTSTEVEFSDASGNSVKID